MKNEMILTDKDGNDIKCEVIAQWKKDGNDYIAYTDGSIIEGELTTFLSKIVGNTIEDIEDYSEWEDARKFLVENLKDDEDEY